jgi:membrane-anchored protein YejM (alkaline phosphatase superfamily)
MVPPRSERFSAVVLAWLGNSCLGAAIGTAWLTELSPWSSARSALFVPAALLSNTAMLAVLPAILVAVLAISLPSARALAAAQALVWTLFQLLIYADTRIWSLFRYHFNGMVWNVITTPGSEDAIDLGPKTWAFAVAVGLALFAVLWLAWTRVFQRDRARTWATRGALALLALVALEKGLYAWADLARDRGVTGVARAFPLYQRLTVQKFAQTVFHAHLEERAAVDFAGGQRLLQYPIEPPRIAPGGPRPNILVFVIDSLRADMLAKETMPRTTAFAARARRFEDHLSGGNATRFGIFSLLYGIHGTYWMPVVEDHAPPVLITTLESLGYDLRALSSSSLSFPEFRSTAFVTMEDRVEDRFGLERRKLLDDTIVIVTGDHGEEFFEHGYFGHTSNFALEQTHVPFVLGGPGIATGIEARPTCHVDLAPTLLELCGADPASRASWSQGENLLAPPDRRDRVIAGWEEVALRVPGGILRVPLEGSRGFVEAYDESWKRFDDEQVLIRNSSAAIARLARECRRFLR